MSLVTYIVNNRSGEPDDEGWIFNVDLHGKSTTTIQTALLSAVNVRLQWGASTNSPEHLLLHSTALTHTGNTRFHHLVGGNRSNSAIVATLVKRLTNKQNFDQYELLTSHRLHLKHPLHQLDFYLTDNHGDQVPVAKGYIHTYYQFELDRPITGSYKNEIIMDWTLSGSVTSNFDSNLVYTWNDNNDNTGTITGQTIDSTWVLNPVTNIVTVYWDFANQGTTQWYQLEVNPSQADQLIAVDDWNNVYTAGALVWTRDAGGFAVSTAEDWTDNGDNAGTVDGLDWEFDSTTGFINLDHGDGTNSVFNLTISGNKIRIKLESSTFPNYENLAADTQIYLEQSSTGSNAPVSGGEVTEPINGYDGEDIDWHIELTCHH